MANPTFEIKDDNEGIQLLIHGDVKVQYAHELKDFLLQSVKRSSNEKLMLEQVTALDVTSVQLAYLWKMSLSKQGRKSTICLPKNESVRELLEKTGITNIL